jgi:hypothetical protein
MELSKRPICHSRGPEGPGGGGEAGVPVRIVLLAPDNVLLAGSNDETQFPGMPGLIGFTLNFLNSAAVICRQGPSAKKQRWSLYFAATSVCW